MIQALKRQDAMAQELLDEVLYPEDYEPAPEVFQAPFDPVDCIIIAYRMGGKSLASVSELLMVEYGHQASAQAVHQRQKKIERFGKLLVQNQSSSRPA
jgi:hypothetical protein